MFQIESVQNQTKLENGVPVRSFTVRHDQSTFHGQNKKGDKKPVSNVMLNHIVAC